MFLEPIFQNNDIWDTFMYCTCEDIAFCNRNDRINGIIVIVIISVPTPQVRKTTTAGTSLLKYIKVTTKKYLQFI